MVHVKDAKSMAGKLVVGTFELGRKGFPPLLPGTRYRIESVNEDTSQFTFSCGTAAAVRMTWGFDSITNFVLPAEWRQIVHLYR